MSYSNGIITAPVSIRDVQLALANNSTDLATLCEAANINPWAMWKPIAARPAQSANKPGRLTLAEVKSQNYGTEINYGTQDFASNNMAGVFENLANNQLNSIVRCTPWSGNNNQWHRLSDFAAPSGQTGGYDHNAQPSPLTYTVGTTSYTLAPLLPPAGRNLIIENGTTAHKYAFPKDYLWLGGYYGTDDAASGGTITRHEGWLAPIDLLTADTYGNAQLSLARRNNPKSVRRGVVIFYWKESESKWILGGSKYCDTPNLGNNPQLNLCSDNTIDILVTNFGQTPYGQIEGRFLFMETYLVVNNNNNYELPIPGFTYEVNITRIAQGSTNLNANGTWDFSLEQTSEVLYLTVVNVQYANDFGYSSFFNSLQVVITAAADGTGTALKTWNLMNFTEGDDEFKEGPTQQGSTYLIRYGFNLNASALGSSNVSGKNAVVVGIDRQGNRRILSCALTAFS